MRWRGALAGVALLAMISVAGKSCGPYFTEAVFVVATGPDSLQDVLEGKPVVIQPQFFFTNLALAYRMMTGPALTAEERKSVLAARRDRMSAEVQTDGLASWVKVSQTTNNEAPINPDHTLPGSSWQTYPNCLDDSFATAARTLSERTKTYPEATAELTDWLRGQNAVFSNCSTQTGQMPAEAPPGSALWLQQDRAYQTAAAHFYRMEWPKARKDFELVAADHASPWHDLADYLIARSLIRQATLGVDSGFEKSPMGEAQQQLKHVISGGGPYAASASQLLNLVEFRLDPSKEAARLGDNLLKPGPQLGQNLTELSFAFDHMSSEQIDAAKKSDLVDWVMSMRLGGEDHSAERWRQTRNLAWLTAAMTHLQNPDPELMKAAAEVPPDSPAWATLTFLRLRLMNDHAAARNQLQQALARLAVERATRSTMNLFTMLAQSKTLSLAEFAKLAPMEPAGFDEDGYMPMAAARDDTGSKDPTMAGLPVNVLDAKRLDVEAATVFNERLPLAALIPLVLDSKWPKQLRFELAMAVWTRAVLLDKPDEARRLTPVMIEGEPGWKPWLAAYGAATTEDERRVTSLLALMRFPSVRPYVNSGAGREEGFVGYSSYRDNWWCARMGRQQDWRYSYSTSYNYRDGAEISSSPEKLSEKLAPFISPAMAGEAQQERAKLETIGDAPTYFGKEALAWVKAHPEDPRNAEVLAFAFRAMRNGCNLEASTATRHQVFDTLHARYPHSEWATYFPKFETDPID